MGKLEERSRQKTRRSKVQEAILITLLSGGRNSSSLLPSVANLLLGTNFSDSSRKQDVVASSARRLTRKGLVTFENGQYHLTKEGERILNTWTNSQYRITRPRKWDKKWRVIIFDIPEKRRKTRTEVRNILIETGFQRLQDSVWVYPFDCEEMIGLLKTKLGIGKYLLYMIVDEIENDLNLRREFDLI